MTNSSRNPLYHYIADSTPLGFFAFAIQTFYNGTVYAQWITADATITFGPAIWYGGVAQLITGVLQLLRGEKVSGTIFAAFGLNWIGTGFLLNPSTTVAQVSAASWLTSDTDTIQLKLNEANKQTGIYFLGWFVFALAYVGVNLRGSVVGLAMSCFVALNFLFLGCGSLVESVPTLKVAGYCMMITALIAFYLGLVSLWRDDGPCELPVLPLRQKVHKQLSASTPDRDAQ